MRISDWSSDVCSSDLIAAARTDQHPPLGRAGRHAENDVIDVAARAAGHRHMAAGDVDVLDIPPWLHPVDALLLQEQDCFGERLARQIPDGRVAALEPAGGMDRIGGGKRSEERRVGQEGVRTCEFWW